MAIHYKYEDYEKISDTLMDFFNGYVFRANVKISYTRNSKRTSFAEEYKYDKGEFQSISIRRDMKESYFSIESKRSSDQNNRFFMIMKYEDIIIAKDIFYQSWRILNEKKMVDKLFTKTPEGDIAIDASINVRIPFIYKNKELTIRPAINRYEVGGNFVTAKAVAINYDDNFIIMTERMVNGIYYILDSTSLVLAAQSMVTHLHSPYLGDRLIDLSGEGTIGRDVVQPEKPAKEITGGAVNRQPKGAYKRENITDLL